MAATNLYEDGKKDIRRVSDPDLRIKDMELETNEIIAIAVRECIQAEYFEKVNVELFVYHTIITAQAWALKYWRLAKITDLDEYIAVNARFLMSSVLTEKGREEFEKVLAG